ncbi:Protein SLG1 [Diatrype stigma]|uniref:Protein SLG1 n=1 Tax=Diatrype stigma TaxID=117547 RepID=A0AAN9UX01_9PEZI
MMSLRRITIAAVLAFASLASAGLQPSPQTPVRGSDTVKGCYKSKGELTLQSEIKEGDFNSRGKCNELCRSKNKNVAATSLDSCYCGDKYPPKADLVDDDQCTEPCPGINTEACGGLDTFSVYNSGVRVSVADSDIASSSSSASSTSTAATVPTEGAESASASSTDAASGSSNTVGIAVGVVCGILAVAGVGGAVFFFMRRRRNTEIEEEHRRNAAVNAFISGGKPPSSSGGLSMSDSRLDPVMVNRRMSDGSIADNQDYSRRILRVTNA